LDIYSDNFVWSGIEKDDIFLSGGLLFLIRPNSSAQTLKKIYFIVFPSMIMTTFVEIRKICKKFKNFGWAPNLFCSPHPRQVCVAEKLILPILNKIMSLDVRGYP
jgi:hypothetical protein